MIPRDRIEIWKPTKTNNGSGGQTITERKGMLVLSSLAEVTPMKPTREQLAEQTKLGQQLKIQLFARKGITLEVGMLLFWKDVGYTLQGPPVENSLRTEWTLNAKSLAV